MRVKNRVKIRVLILTNENSSGKSSVNTSENSSSNTRIRSATIARYRMTAIGT